MQQRRECLIEWEGNGPATLHLMDGDKIVWSTPLPMDINNPTLEPVYETVENMGIRANQEQGLDAQGKPIDIA